MVVPLLRFALLGALAVGSRLDCGVYAVKRKDDQTSLGFIDALSSLMSAPGDIIGSAFDSGKEDESFTIADADAPAPAGDADADADAETPG